MQKTKFAGLAAVFYLFCVSFGSVSAWNHVFLFDSSLSMQNYYSILQFRKQLEDVFNRVTTDNDRVWIGQFNQSIPAIGHQSPIWRVRGVQVSGLNFNFNNLIVDPNGHYTDLLEALKGAKKEKELITQRTGVIWLATDNIQDVTGGAVQDSDVGQIRQFYDTLRVDSSIVRIYTYPVQPLGGLPRGYAFYALYYYDRPEERFEKVHEFDTYMRNNMLNQLFGVQPMICKPLEENTLILQPERIGAAINSKGFHWERIGNRYLLLGKFEEKDNIRGELRDISIRSTFSPYFIRSADINVSLRNLNIKGIEKERLPNVPFQDITPSVIDTPVGPGDRIACNITFKLPREISHPKFSWNNLLSDALIKPYYAIKGELVLEVSNADLYLEDSYLNTLNNVWGVAELPDLFLPKNRLTITDRCPFEIQVMFGMWRMWLLLGIALAGLLPLALLSFWCLKKRKFTVIVEGDERLMILNLSRRFPVLFGWGASEQVIGYFSLSPLGKVTFRGTPGAFIGDTNKRFYSLARDEGDIPVKFTDFEGNECGVNIHVRKMK